MTLILPELRQEARTMLFQVQQSGRPVKSREVPIKRDDRRYLIDLVAHPYKEEDTDGGVCSGDFRESRSRPTTELAAITVLQTESQVLSNLERELQRTKLHLQDIIEQSEVSSEELKTSNEEMLTVNFELKTKVEETDKINDYLTGSGPM